MIPHLPLCTKFLSPIWPFHPYVRRFQRTMPIPPSLPSHGYVTARLDVFVCTRVYMCTRVYAPCQKSFFLSAWMGRGPLTGSGSTIAFSIRCERTLLPLTVLGYPATERKGTIHDQDYTMDRDSMLSGRETHGFFDRSTMTQELCVS